MSPRVSVVPAAAMRAMPWRNGGGTTTELAIEPPGATLDGGFLWRVSVAEVATSGPFSAFPGYRRTIAVVTGAGMTLEFADGERHRLDEPLVPFEFDGARSPVGTLLAGPVRDFNLIRDASRVRARWQPLRGDRPAGVFATAGDCVLLACLAGRLDVRVDGDAQALAAGDLLRVDDAGRRSRVAVAETAPGTLGLLVDLERVAAG